MTTLLGVLLRSAGTAERLPSDTMSVKNVAHETRTTTRSTTTRSTTTVVNVVLFIIGTAAAIGGLKAARGFDDNDILD